MNHLKMHKENNIFNGNNLQGLSSPQGASDPVQMNSRVNQLVEAPYYSSSHNTSHPCFFSEQKWSHIEVVLVMNFLAKKFKRRSSNDLIQILNKVNNYLSFYQTISSKSKDDINKLIKYIEKNRELEAFSEEDKKLAEIIEFFIDTQYVNSTVIDYGNIDHVQEGNILIKEHFCRERDYRIIKQKKSEVLTNTGALKCEVCDFNYSNTYGIRGHNFIEVHHTKPISEYKANDVTKLSDLSVLCSSCHKIIHRYQPWLTINELKKTINKKSIASSTTN